MEAVRYTTSLAGLSPEHFDGFSVGWAKPLSGDRLLNVLKASHRAVVAVNEDGRIVGFVQAISDGVLSAYIPLLEVRPDWQGRGIGTALMERVLEELKDLYMVDLCCELDLAPFYERLGMQHVAGMARRNFEALNA